MRTLFPVAFCLLVLGVLLTSSSAQVPKGTEQLAQQIFHEADVNRNDFLNEAEFGKSQVMLHNAVMALAARGLIGKKGKDDKKRPALISPDPDQDEKVTLLEYAAYVDSMLLVADADLVRYREQLEKQRKAAQERAKNRRRRRR